MPAGIISVIYYCLNVIRRVKNIRSNLQYQGLEGYNYIETEVELELLLNLENAI